MPNFCMTLSYDGTRYNGWQRAGQHAGHRAGAARDRAQRPARAAGRGRGLRPHGCGRARPDADGVVPREDDLPAPELLRRLRAQLPGDIGVLTLTEAGPRFHARLSCRGKTYVYRVWNSDTPNVFERRYVYALPQPLDTAAMQRAAALLCGRHDYTSFCANRHMKKSAVRTVDAITVERLGEEVRLTFSGEGFLYHMVRILTGTLLEVGLGQRDARHDGGHSRRARPRRRRADSAARGLILWETRYAHTHPETGEEKRE